MFVIEKEIIYKPCEICLIYKWTWYLVKESNKSVVNWELIVVLQELIVVLRELTVVNLEVTPILS